MHPEVERIINVPRCDYSAHVEQVRSRYDWLIRPGAMLHGQPFRWFPDQVAALLAVEHVGGGLFMVEVGGGKTYITFAIPMLFPESRPLLLVPASLVEKTHEKWREVAHVLNIRPVRVWSYESLSVKSGASKLDIERPTLLLADEAHYLRYTTSARTKRVLRYLVKNPHVRLICLSGTLTGKSLHHYAHLSQCALGLASPLPHKRSVLDAFARVIDPDKTPAADDMQYLAPLRDAFAPGEWGAQGHVKAFSERLRSSPGVIISAGDGPKCSLQIKRWRSLKAPQVIHDAMRLVESGKRPDGQILARPVDAWRCKRELTSGYYNVWDWENHTADGLPDLVWLDARSRWGEVERRHTRSLHLDDDEPLDSARQVWEHFQERLRLQSDVAFSADDEAFLAWREQRQKKPPPTVACWVSTYLVDLAEEMRRRVQAKPRKLKPFLLWVNSIPMQRALADRGFSVRGQGSAAPDTPADLAMGVVACSIEVHGKGANLQFQWSRNVVLEPPASASKWEQLLGRTHRNQQPEDEVDFLVVDHARNLRAQWEKVLQQARYVEATEKRRQRLLYADTVIV